jgi:hypothetical protein
MDIAIANSALRQALADMMVLPHEFFDALESIPHPHHIEPFGPQPPILAYCLLVALDFTWRKDYRQISEAKDVGVGDKFVCWLIDHGHLHQLPRITAMAALCSTSQATSGRMPASARKVAPSFRNGVTTHDCATRLTKCPASTATRCGPTNIPARMLPWSYSAPSLMKSVCSTHDRPQDRHQGLQARQGRPAFGALLSSP